MCQDDCNWCVLHDGLIYVVYILFNSKHHVKFSGCEIKLCCSFGTCLTREPHDHPAHTNYGSKWILITLAYNDVRVGAIVFSGCC